ncbi:MAG: ATP-binding protein [Limisphaerales bacterium]
MSKLRVFVSSVQQELENERVAIAELISADPFLSKHCEAILFEKQPASTLPAEQAYVAALDSCEVYVGIIGFEYGCQGPDGLSATHREYLRARDQKMPVYFFVKGSSARDKSRDDNMRKLFAAVRDARTGHTYRRFNNYQELKQLVRDVLLPILRKSDGVEPTDVQQAEFENTLSAASDFDRQLLGQVEFTDLDQNLTRQYVTAVRGDPPASGEVIIKTLLNRGLLWKDGNNGAFRPTAAGLLLLGKAPDAVFPQCRIAANAYGGTEKGEPNDRKDIRQPLPKAIQEAIDFLVKNMRHTNRISGFARFAVDEYPYEALREALINALAHRDYALHGSSIRVEKFADRIVITSPGLPPPPITLAKIRSLKYLPCSRNPNLARGLSFFERIEEQGDGIRRMVGVTRDLGLPEPEFQNTDGHFVVTFKGPGESLHKLKSQSARPLFEVAPSVLDRLTAHQKSIVRQLLKTGEIQVPALAAKLKVTEQAIRKDMGKLAKLKLVEKRGAARATFYVLKETLASP